MIFKSVLEAEKHLETLYINKVLQVDYYTKEGLKSYIGKLDNIAIDAATKTPPVVILIFNDGKRFEIEKDDFSELIKILN